jgi:hypothetical protein
MFDLIGRVTAYITWIVGTLGFSGFGVYYLRGYFTRSHDTERAGLSMVPIAAAFAFAFFLYGRWLVGRYKADLRPRPQQAKSDTSPRSDWNPVGGGEDYEEIGKAVVRSRRQETVDLIHVGDKDRGRRV